MSSKFIENNKIINALPPVSHASGFNGSSDIISMKNYQHATIIITTGASSTSDSVLTVNAATDVAGGTNAAIAFQYRKNILTADAFSALANATVSGVAMTASKANSVYVIELDAAELLAAGQAYDCFYLTATADTSNAQLVAVTVILSQPKYPQENLPSAIVD